MSLVKLEIYKDIRVRDVETWKENRIIKLIENKKYSVSTTIQGIKGKKGCGYFAVIFLDPDGIEIKRLLRWIDDFSGKGKKYEITFQGISNVVIGYRINGETPINADCDLKVTPLDNIQVKEMSDQVKESFEVFSNCSFERPEEFSKNDEILFEKQLVWIIGTGRSGTTWLGTQLLTHETYFVDESQIGLHLGSITLDGKRNLDVYGESYNYFYGKMYAETWKYYLRKLILYRFYTQFRSRSKKIIIKEPSASIIVDILSEILPNSKIIFLIRDGRDVVDSNVDAFSKNSWLTKTGVSPRTELNRIELIKRISEGWKKRTEIMLGTCEKHPAENQIIIKYEELLNDTFNILKRIYAFLEIEISEDKLSEIIEKYSFKNIPEAKKGSGKFTRSASPGDYKKNLTEEEIKIINDIIKPVLEKLDYE